MRISEKECFIDHDPGGVGGEPAAYVLCRWCDSVLVIEASGVAVNDNF